MTFKVLHINSEVDSLCKFPMANVKKYNMFTFLNKPKCQWYTGFYFTAITPTFNACVKSTDIAWNARRVKRNISVASPHIIFCLNDFWQTTTAFSTIEFNE